MWYARELTLHGSWDSVNMTPMKIRLIVALCLYAIGASCSHAGRETYAEWVEDGTPSGVELQFLPWRGEKGRSFHSISQRRDNRPGRSGDDKHWHVPIRPTGGLIGHMHVSRPVEGDDEILTLRLLYSLVSKEDLVREELRKAAFFSEGLTGDEQALFGMEYQTTSWGDTMMLLDPNSPTRPVCYSYEKELSISPGNDVAVVPVLLPREAHRIAMFGVNEKLLSCRVELLDSSGRPVARSLLVECFFASPWGYGRQIKAWVTEEAEADRALRELAGISEPTTVLAFSREMEPYGELAALWMSEDVWERGDLGSRELRRLLLMGLWVYGRSNTVSALTREIGLAAEGAVLTGGVDVPDSVTAQARSANRNRGARGGDLWDTSVSHWTEGQTFPLENRIDLFAPLKAPLVAHTLIVLGGFALAICIGVPLAFLRLKGARRARLWWGIPLVSFLFAAFGLGGGHLFLARDTQWDVTEYRFGYAGWPEVYCQSVARFLSFKEQNAQWSIPDGGFLWPNSAYLSKSASRSSLSYAQNESLYQLFGLNPGETSRSEVSFFATNAIPLRTTAGTPQSIEALAPLRSVHVWYESGWRAVGDMKAGDVVDLSGVPCTNRVVGLPARIAALFPDRGRHGRSRCGVSCEPIRKSIVSTVDDVFSGKALIAIARADETPLAGLQCDAPGTGRVVWVVQLPIDRSPESSNRNED